MKWIVSAACAISMLVAASAASANGDHRHSRHKQAHRGHADVVVVTVPAERVAAFRRAHIDWRIGPAGRWVGKDRYFYRPYHYWRGPLVYRRVAKDYVLFPRFAPTTFVCKETRRGDVCRER